MPISIGPGQRSSFLGYAESVVEGVAEKLSDLLPVDTASATQEFMAKLQAATDQAIPFTIQSFASLKEGLIRSAASYLASKYRIAWNAVQEALGINFPPVEDFSLEVFGTPGLISVLEEEVRQTQTETQPAPETITSVQAKPETSPPKPTQPTEEGSDLEEKLNQLVAFAVEQGLSQEDARTLAETLVGDRTTLSDSDLETLKQLIVAYVETKTPKEPQEPKISRDLFVSTHLPMLKLAGFTDTEAISIINRVLGEKTELSEDEFTELSNRLMSEIDIETPRPSPEGGIPMEIVRALLDPAFKRAGWTESQINNTLTEIWERHGFGPEITPEQTEIVVSEINHLLEGTQPSMYQPSEEEAWNNFIHQEILTAFSDIENQLGWTLPLDQENAIYDEVEKEAKRKLKEAIEQGISYPSIDAFRSELQTLIYSKARSLISGAHLSWLRREANKRLRSKIENTWSEYSRNLAAELQTRGIPVQTIKSDLTDIWMTIEHAIEPALDDAVKAQPLASPDVIADTAFRNIMGRVQQSMNDLRSRVYAAPKQRVYSEMGLRKWRELLPQVIRTNYGAMIRQKSTSPEDEEQFIQMLADKAMEIAMTKIGQPFSATTERDSYWDLFAGSVAVAVARYWNQLWTTLEQS